MKQGVFSIEQAKSGDKNFYRKVGEIYQSKSGKSYLKLYMQPEVSFAIMEDKPREEREDFGF